MRAISVGCLFGVEYLCFAWSEQGVSSYGVVAVGKACGVPLK